MRLFWILVAAAQLLGGLQTLAWLAQAQYPQSARVATSVFIAVWFAVTAFNLWVGVAKVGYPLAEEIPIHLLIVGVPVAASLLLQWKLLS